MKILSETNFADNYAFLIIKNCTIILGSYRHITSITFILAEIIVQIHSQQNLRNAYRAADQQYRPEVEVTYSLSRIFIQELQESFRYYFLNLFRLTQTSDGRLFQSAIVLGMKLF
jgi:hypothetical protein